MKVRGSGTAPLNSAPEKSKPGFCGHGQAGWLQIRGSDSMQWSRRYPGGVSLAYLFLEPLEHELLLDALGGEGVHLHAAAPHRPKEKHKGVNR